MSVLYCNSCGNYGHTYLQCSVQGESFAHHDTPLVGRMDNYLISCVDNLRDELAEAKKDSRRLSWEYKQYVKACNATGHNAISYDRWRAAIDSAIEKEMGDLT